MKQLNFNLSKEEFELFIEDVKKTLGCEVDVTHHPMGDCFLFSAITAEGDILIGRYSYGYGEDSYTIFCKETKKLKTKIV